MPELRKALMRFDARILATKLPQMPDGLLQEMLCDAYLYHLGTLDFFACDVLMKKETELNQSGAVSIFHWQSRTAKLLKAHQYHTIHCRKRLDEQKAKNLAKLELMLHTA